VAVSVPSTCGRRGTAVAGQIRAVATATLTVSTRCRSVARRNMERDRGTSRSARRRSLRPTVAERTTANARL